MDELDRERRGRAADEDRAAIGRRLEGQASRLRAAVLSVGVAPGDADDLVQEALARALAHWRDGGREPESERALASWLATIARNVALDWRRRRERERRLSDARDPESLVERSDRAADPVAAGGEGVAIPGVSSEALALLALRYREGLSGREIAARLGLSCEAVKKRLQRARAEALAHLRGNQP